MNFRQNWEFCYYDLKWEEQGADDPSSSSVISKPQQYVMGTAINTAIANINIDKNNHK